jgi:hypothetical protein
MDEVRHRLVVFTEKQYGHTQMARVRQDLDTLIAAVKSAPPIAQQDEGVLCADLPVDSVTIDHVIVADGELVCIRSETHRKHLFVLSRQIPGSIRCGIVDTKTALKRSLPKQPS